MKLTKDILLEYMENQSSYANEDSTFTTQELSSALNLQRSNISKLLNELLKDNLVKKSNGRPVLYSLNKVKEESVFSEMIGYQQSLKQAVQLVKAALLYPGRSLPILLTGPDGSGKSLLAKLIFEYAKQREIIDENASLIKVNCRYLAEESPEEIWQQFFDEKTGALNKAKNGLLFVDHINRLCHDIQKELLNYVETGQGSNNQLVVVYSIDDAINQSMASIYKSKFSIVVDLPSLAERCFDERFELVQFFLRNEAKSIHKTINADSKILQCLTLYLCKSNVKQLMIDIKLGCANAYARNFDRNCTSIELQMSDFPNYVNKGILSYRKYREQIELLIPDNTSYSFSLEEIKQYHDDANYELSENYYAMIDQKIESLKSHGVDDEDITTIIHADLEYQFNQLNSVIEKNEIDKDMIAKLVDSKIINLVEKFLNEATLKFGRIYSNSIFYGLCLHINGLLDKKISTQQLSNDQIVSTIKEYNDEYIYCSHFASILEKELKLQMSIDEVVFLAMFLIKEQMRETNQSKPVVLVAMHGDSTAASIVNVANSLVGGENIFAFDLSLDKDMQKVYEELSQTIIDIHQGKGILMLYDMGSLKTMAQMISKETGIEIKSFCIPATLIALDCSRKANSQVTLDEIYNDVVNSYQAMYPELEQSYQIQEKPQVIITLCMTGNGAAIQMKNYIEQYLLLENTEIIPMAISNKEYLLKKVNQIQKNQKVICVIGVYDPHLYGVPYIPISKLFDTTPDKLEMLLSLNTTESVKSVNYSAIYEYLKEELKDFDFKLLKEIMPKVMKKIIKASHGLTSDQEVGLFMHIACAIYRLQKNDDSNINVNTASIIAKHKRLYNDLKDIFEVINEEFYVEFNDDEIAYVIQIIKKC